MKKLFKKIVSAVRRFVLWDPVRSSVDNGLCDFSGQGRDKYGR